MISPADLEAIIDLVAAYNVNEVLLEIGGQTVRIRNAIHVEEHASSAELPAVSEVHVDEYLLLSQDEPVTTASHTTVTSPTVGIFHHAEPPAAPGSRVAAGQLVGTIETMRLHTDIKAPEAGIVQAALVEAGMPVEYGQPLIEILRDRGYAGESGPEE